MTCDSFVKRLRRDESGQTLVLAAIMLPVLIGFVGFAIDVGYAFDYKKQMQMAADSAAMAGAIAVKANGSINSTDLATVVTMDTANNGFTNGTAGIAVSVCRPAVDFTCPTTYTYTAGDGAVKVSISQAKDTFFTKILNFNSLTVGASAVAAATTVSGNNSSIVILDTACRTGFQSSNIASSTIVNGSIYVNSCGQTAVQVSGGGILSAAGGVFVVGDYQASGGSTITPTPTTGMPQIADPLASLPVPTPTGTPYPAQSITSGTVTLDPGIYTGGITISGTANVTFSPGEYYLNGGGLRIKNDATVSGAGVFFYAYNSAELKIENDTTTTMSAPTSGTYRGIWYFQQRTNAKDATFSSGGVINVTGVIYVSAPGSSLDYTGGASSGTTALYTVYVLWRMSMSGGSTFNTNFSSIGGSPLAGGVSGLALAE